MCNPLNTYGGDARIRTGGKGLQASAHHLATSPIKKADRKESNHLRNQSGKAEACKAFTPGSNPGVASIRIQKGLHTVQSFFVSRGAC